MAEKKSQAEQLKEKLFYVKKHATLVMSEQEEKKADKYCEGYKKFLDAGKTEREAAATAAAMAEKAGFKPFDKKAQYKACLAHIALKGRFVQVLLQGGADIGLPGRYRLPQRGQRAAAESGVFCRACIEKSPLGGYQLFNLHALALLWFIVVWVVAVSIACYNALVNIVFAGAAPRLSENERALPCGRRLRNTCKTEERRE